MESDGKRWKTMEGDGKVCGVLVPQLSTAFYRFLQLFGSTAFYSFLQLFGSTAFYSFLRLSTGFDMIRHDSTGFDKVLVPLGLLLTTTRIQ